MNLGRKIAKSSITGKPNSINKKGLYFQIGLAEYFQSQKGNPTSNERDSIIKQSHFAIDELRKVLLMLKTPIKIINDNWGIISPQAAKTIKPLIEIENKLHALWSQIQEIAKPDIEEIISEIEEVNRKI